MKNNHEEVGAFYMSVQSNLLDSGGLHTRRRCMETPTPAPSSTAQSTQIPGLTPDTQTNMFSSDIYHYTVIYPSDWIVQVNTDASSSVGSNPEYVTLTANNPSNLPRINNSVLTNAPRMNGFEKCDQNFVFRNIPECKISLPTGQTPASEVWVFQNGTAHFFIGMQYEDLEPVQIFTDFLSSFEFTQSLPTATPQLNKGTVYRDEVNGFELIYPTDMSVDPCNPIGSRASQALLLSPGTTVESLAAGSSRISIVIYSWEPKNDLNAYIMKRKDAWNASGTKLIEETELKLANERLAVSFILENTDQQREYILISMASEKYLEIVGQGNLTLIQEIAQTLSPTDLLRFNISSSGR